MLRFLDAAGLMKREARNNPQKAEPGKKAKERAAARAEKAGAAEGAGEARKPRAWPGRGAPTPPLPAELLAAARVGLLGAKCGRSARREGRLRMERTR